MKREDGLPASRGRLKEPRKKKREKMRKVAMRARIKRKVMIASLLCPRNSRLRNHQSHLPRPKFQLNQAKKTVMRGKREWLTMMWMHVIRYARRVDIHEREPPKNVIWDVRPAR